jgi:hypothetical protein
MTSWQPWMAHQNILMQSQQTQQRNKVARCVNKCHNGGGTNVGCATKCGLADAKEKTVQTGYGPGKQISGYYNGNPLSFMLPLSSTVKAVATVKAFATGAPDSGAPDSGAPDSGAPDSGAPDSGAPDSGAPDSGAVLGQSLFRLLLLVILVLFVVLIMYALSLPSKLDRPYNASEPLSETRQV